MVMATEKAPALAVTTGGPRIGLATATFVVVSSMIGTGVLTTSGFTVYFVGSNQLMLVFRAVGGVLALVRGAEPLRAVGRVAALGGRLTSSSPRRTARWRPSCRAGSRS